MKRLTRLRLFTILLALCVCLTGCSDLTDGQTAPDSDPQLPPPDQIISSVVSADLFSSEDLESAWQAESATAIVCRGDTAEISGTGATVDGATITISAAGTYVLSGDYEGRIIIHAGSGDLVRLIFNGFSIHYGQSAAIWSQQAKKTIITLVAQTENKITDGDELAADYIFAEEEPNGALYSQDDLTINGEGSLTIVSAAGHGIITKDHLRLVSGTYDISAAKDALRGRDSVVILDGHYALESGGDGIQSNQTEDGKGFVTLLGGIYNLNAARDGIQAESDLTILGGTYQIFTGQSEEIDAAESYKGLKAGGGLTIEAGVFDITAADDALHANGDMFISGGELTLSSGDDGVHADGDLTISGGNVQVLTCYEGLEGNNVYLSGGDIWISASDDAINAAGGTDSGTAGQFGADNFRGGNHVIEISGGTICAVGGDDGIDSNGGITISGGFVEVYVSSTPDNTALDCDGTLTISGGTVIYGGTGTGATDTTTQSYAVLSSLQTGEKVVLFSGSEELLRFTPELDCQSLLISAPFLIQGESYQVVIQGESQTLEAGTGAPASGFGGGRQPGQNGGRPNMGDMPELPEGGEMPEWDSFPEGELPEPGTMPQDGTRPQRGDGGQRPEGAPPSAPTEE